MTCALVRFTMDFAQSGAGALDEIGNAGNASLILILSDINMPKMTVLSPCRGPRGCGPTCPSS